MQRTSARTKALFSIPRFPPFCPHLGAIFSMRGQRWRLSSAPLLFCAEHKELGTKAASMGSSKQLGMCLQKDLVKIPRNAMQSAIIYSVYNQFAIYKMKVIG